MTRDDDRDTRRGRDDAPSGRGGSRSRFEYKSRDPEVARRRAESGADNEESWLKGAVKIYKPAQGDNTIRVLPPTWDGAKHYGIDIFVHYGIGSDNGAYLCLKKHGKGDCAICEERDRATKKGDEEYAQELRAGRRVVSYIIDRSKERDGVQVLSMGTRTDQDMAAVTVDKKDGSVLEVDHPENGYDISFTRTGEMLKTRYSGWQTERRPSPLDNDDAMQFAVDNPLPDQLQFFTYEHIAKVFAGSAPPSKNSDREETTRGVRDDPHSSSSSSRTRDDDRDPPRRSPPPQPAPAETYEDVQGMKFRELSTMCKTYRLDIDPEASRDDQELADQICAALRLEKQACRASRVEEDDAPAPRRRALTEPAPEEDTRSPRERLRGMRY